MSPSSLSPQHQQQGDEIQFSHDKHFALHGLITLLTVVSVFFLFILFILTIPCLKRAASSAATGSEAEGRRDDEDSNVAVAECSTPSTQRGDGILTQTPPGLMISNSEVISRKFP
ncbi:uncharacterized protein LOC129299175 [Prosopis cineraria]|uniref:uncharacterized protein LOC129299175 n=1 Tax=Prosopis cineraria TaxID=364024 RepID=UPI00240EFEC2|nr:uncharacterized protein LOC129299175 [Prosopis cineraria]